MPTMKMFGPSGGEGGKSAISASKEYNSFRVSVARKTISTEHGEKDLKWRLYDHGPKQVRCPLIFLPPISGTADIFFKQLMSLGSTGYRCIAVDYPPYWNHDEWCEGFLQLLDQLRLDQVHLFGASLGGFLAQKFASYTAAQQRVQSLTLCNSFADTSAFKAMPPHPTYKLMPLFVMKRIILEGYTRGSVEAEVANSIDFMVEQIDGFSRSELASRLTLNTLPAYIEPQHIAAQGIKVMLLFPMDQTAITSKIEEELLKCYHECKEARIKNGGNFPYLARDQEVNLYIRVHLRQFEGSRYSAGDDFDWGESRGQ